MSRVVAKTENVHKHPPAVELVDLKASCDTHTHTFSFHTYTMSGTHPMSRTQGSLLFLQSSISTRMKVLQWSCFVCMEISQDVTVKRYVEVLNWRSMTNPSMFPYVMYHVYSKSQNKKRTRQCITPETKMMFLHSTSPSTATVQVHSFHQQLHNSCEIQHDHDHNDSSAAFSDTGNRIFLCLWELQWV